MHQRRFLFGPFVFDVGRKTLLSDGEAVALGHRGLAVLEALLRARGQIVTKTELMDAAWPGVIVEESNLSVQVAALRKLLEPAADSTEWIVTVPRVGYRFAGVIKVEEGFAPRTTSLEPADSTRRPSLAVMPFVNLSQDAEQEYFADGITEDISNALARFRWFFISARHCSFALKGKGVDIKQIASELDVRYVLTGSVRKWDQQVRVSAQLHDGPSAHQLWTGRYDVERGDFFRIQDQIAEQVAGAIEPELLKTESITAAKRRYVGDSNGLDFVYQGTWLFHQITRATHFRARDLFRKARELDPDLPEASVWLARANAGMLAYGWTEDPQADLLEGVDAALKAVQIDEQNPYAHYALAITGVYSGMLERAVRAAEKAVDLSPSFALGHLAQGMAMLFSGDAAQAIVSLEYGLGLNPYDPQNFIWYNALALAHLFSGDAGKARDSALKALEVRPTWRPTLELLAISHAEIGDMQNAKAWVDQIAPIEKPPGDVFGPLKKRNPKWADVLDSLLRKAGAEA